MKNRGTGLIMVIVLVALIMVGNSIRQNRATAEAMGNQEEEKESMNPYYMDDDDDVLERVVILDKIAKESDPTAVLLAMQYEEGESRWEVMFEGESLFVVYYINVVSE